jgi:hypothetical protein
MFHPLTPTDMKALQYPLTLAIFATLLSSCFSSQGNLYSQRYDNSYSYYNEDSYSYSSNSVISFNVFYNELTPYGRWINNNQYGRVWVPNVGRDFHPYATNGYWVMTDYGNTWVSNYSWGWAPFHYGRWFFDDYYGWSWIPGYEWAPAWVTWRSGGGYYGWAPMAPGIHINININLPGSYWTFIPHNRMYHRDMHRYYSRYSQNIYNKTTIINNTYIYNNNRYYSGPTSREIERTTGRKVTVHRLESSNNRSGRSTVVSNNTVSVYRPDASATRTTSTRSSSSTGTAERTTSTRSTSTSGNVGNSTSTRSSSSSGKVDKTTNARTNIGRSANSSNNEAKPANTRSTNGRTATSSDNVDRSNNRSSQSTTTTVAPTTRNSSTTRSAERTTPTERSSTRSSSRSR